MSPITIPADIAKRAAQFVGRTWVLDKVVAWLADPSGERFFLLAGEPGSGKTALAAWLAAAGPEPADSAEALRLRTLREAWSAAHFCVARGQGESVNPGQFARSLAQQLADHFVEFAGAAVRAIDPEYDVNVTARENWGEIVGIKTQTLVINGKHPDDIYELAVRGPLRALCTRLPNLKVLILVDGLDEALAYGEDHNIVELLAGSTELPTAVRFFITCRSNERRVIDCFDDLCFLDISAPEQHAKSVSDVQAFVLARLSDEPLRGRIPAGETPESLADRLVKRADQNFLYLSFLLDEIAAGTRGFDQLEGLPDGLYGLYRGYLDRVIRGSSAYGSSDPWIKRYAPLLGTLGIAVPVAPTLLLKDWLGWNDNTEVNSSLDDVTQLIECLADPLGSDALNALASAGDDAAARHLGPGCRLYHQSLADFMAAPEYKDKTGLRRNNYYVDLFAQHDRIARYYLAAYREGWQDCDAYGLRQLVSHLRQRVALAPEADRAGLAAQLYEVVLNSSFRDAQKAYYRSSYAMLPDLRSALETALSRDDLIPALRIIAAYRNAVDDQGVADTIFDAVAQADFAAAEAAAGYYGPAPKPRGRWARVLHFYLAWEAAEAGQPASAKASAAAAESLAPTDWSHALYEELSDALLVRAARRLVAPAADDAAVSASLVALVPRRDPGQLLAAHRLPAGLTAGGLREKADLLARQLAGLEALAHEGSPDYNPEAYGLDSEAMSANTYALRTLLTELSPYREGQDGIDRALELNVVNPYPRYRDIALVPIAIAAASVSNAEWARSRLQRVLRAGLDVEGITFTFDLPSILLAEAQRRGRPVQGLAQYVDAAQKREDSWGTRVRAASALAAAQFWQGKGDEAWATLAGTNDLPRSYAGFASMAALLLANRCHEFGDPARSLRPVWGSAHNATLVTAAGIWASLVNDPSFRDERVDMVRRYTDWTSRPAPTVAELRSTLGEIQDPDARRVYKDLAAARWVAASPPNEEGLKALVPMVLNDSTTLDAILGRLFGLHIRRALDGSRAWPDADLDAAIATCDQHFTARPFPILGIWSH